MRRVLYFLVGGGIALTLSATAAGQPVRHSSGALDQDADNCAAALVVTALPYSDAGSTSGLTNDFNTAAACAAGGVSHARDVIYRFVPSATERYVVSTCGSGYNTLLEVRTGGLCPGSSPVACADGGCGEQAELTHRLNQGQTYFLIVDGWGGECGSYTLDVRREADPPCHDLVLAAPGSVSGNTCDAGDDCDLAEGDEQIVQITIPFTDEWLFDFCQGAGRNYRFSLGTSCCDAATILRESDTRCSIEGGTTPTVYVPLEAGTYYLRVEQEGSWPEPCGAFTLAVHPSRGRCCYGDDDAPLCGENLTHDACAIRGGNFIEGATCTTDPCAPRPRCQQGSQFSQRPYLPYEQWWDCVACPPEYLEPEPAYYEHFAGLTAPLQAVRFWGLQEDDLLWEGCERATRPLRVQVYADSAGQPGALEYTCDVGACAAFVLNGYQSYSGTLWAYQFDVTLDPPCPVISGWIALCDPDANSRHCRLRWLHSPVGDGLSLHRYGDQFWQDRDLSLCLNGAFQTAANVVITPPDENGLPWLVFDVLEPGWYTVFYATDADAVFPAGYSVYAAFICELATRYAMGLNNLSGARYFFSIAQGGCGMYPWPWVARQGVAAPLIHK